MRPYLVIYEDGPNNLNGFAPDVSGCASSGRSLKEMRDNLREALEFHLEGLALDGETLPLTKTRMVERPVNCIAEWLTVGLPVSVQVVG